MEKALLIVSFGTSCPEVLERDIVPVERAIQEALPEYVPLRAFGSGMIARKLRQQLPAEKNLTFPGKTIN